MLFNSLEFAAFLPIFFAAYWLLSKRVVVWQNLLVVAGSYFFYAQWRWEFLGLIVASTVIDYSLGIAIARSLDGAKRKALLWASIGANLAMLGMFKYAGFFVDSWIDLWRSLGFNMNERLWEIALPVGISFYTFQTLSYSIDVYRRKIEPTRDFVAYAAYVSFFPQLVAGPIERATNLLPQFLKRREMNADLAIDGFRQFAWGLFKKVVVADNCGFYADGIFARADTHIGSVLALGVVYFAFQIYADFSGYSDMAIGTGKMLGIRLSVNFRYPYFSRDIAEFWRRWHISLSTWFRDYVYFSLGGSRCGTGRNVFNVMVVFVLSGFWHGASWNFVIWGSLNALYFLPLLLMGRNRNHLDTVAEGKWLPSVVDFLRMACTFVLAGVAWVWFRAEDVTSALGYFKGLLSRSLFSLPLEMVHGLERYAFEALLVVVMLLCFEWFSRSKEHPVQGRHANLVLAAVIFCTLVFGTFVKRSEFIYFQF
jgi:alginate O-acetyltransferase complex protein AlgI